MLFAFLFGLAAYLIYLSSQCSFRVEEGFVGVLSVFGAAAHAGAKLKSYGPGLHTKAPWAKVHLVCMKEQNLDLSGERGGKLAMTDDGTLLRLDSILRYVPEADNLEHFLFGMKAPLDHITSLFTCLLRNKIANFRDTPAGSSKELSPALPIEVASQDAGPVSIRSIGFSIDDSIGSYALIRRERRQLNQRIEEFCRHEIGHRYGVKFQGVDLTDILPPDELSDALNAVMSAQSEAETHYFHAESTCHHRIVSAREGVAIAAKRAEAVENEIRTLGEFLSELRRIGQLDPYVRRRRAEVTSESKTLYVKELSGHGDAR